MDAALTGANTANGPAWAPAGDELYFSSDRTAVGQDRLYRSSYFGGVFGTPTLVSDLASTTVSGAAFTPDGLELYWSHTTGLNAGYMERAARMTTSDPWIVTGVESQLSIPGGLSGFPTFSSDGLTMYFEGVNGTTYSIYRASRASTSERFVSYEQVPEIATWPDVAAIGDPDVSSDNTRMLVAIDRMSTTTQHDIFLSMRTCE